MAEEKQNGAIRCPKCGATDILLDQKSGKLKCTYCRFLFANESVNEMGGVEQLEGTQVGEGASDIIPDENTILTLKCPSCAAEVVINTDEAATARCHWCRHVLTVRDKLPNGASPDMVLPFKLEKKVAEKSIDEFVKKRQFFANPKFKAEFNSNNVMGVYLPYFVVDANTHALFKGEAEHKTRSYQVKSGNTTKTYYDADAYDVEREFDMYVDDLTIEASKDKINQEVGKDSKNVINAIMPFDTQNSVGWDPRYLRGYASEKRDVNVDQLDAIVKVQIEDMARYRARTTMAFYDRGTKWSEQTVTVKGTKWKSAYLPIWLYSYLEDDGKTKLLHYVAVNARTGETSGSVPVYKKKLMAVSVAVEILGMVIGFIWMVFWLGVDTDDDNPWLLGLAGLTPGFIFYWVQMNKYRSLNARHTYEKETSANMDNVRKVDNLREHRKRLTDPRIAGENDNELKGALSKGGKQMLGEKMATALGIDKLTGSPTTMPGAEEKK